MKIPLLKSLFNEDIYLCHKNEDIYITSEIYGFCNEIKYYSFLNDNHLYIIDNNILINDKINNDKLILKPYIYHNIIQINNTYPDMTIEVKNNKTFNNLNIPTEVITMN